MRLLILYTLLFLGCKQSEKLDLSKIDENYLLGEYITDFAGYEEHIILKKNGLYDFYSRDKDTAIKNCGKWNFVLLKNSISIDFNDYPNLRNDKIDGFENNKTKVNLPFSLDAGSDGDIESYVITKGGGEQYFTYEKVDKSKNKNYIKK